MSPCHAYPALLLPAGPTHPDSCSLAPDKPDIRSLDSSDAYSRSLSKLTFDNNHCVAQRIIAAKENAMPATGTELSGT